MAAVAGAAAPELSIVVPAFNEEENLASLHRAVAAAAEPLAGSWELVFCDDGSSDGTWREIARLSAADARVRGVRLSRNFGHQSALLAGLTAAAGSAVVTMDADHQHPPALLPELVAAWRGGAKIVHTVRRDAAAAGVFKRASSRLFYGLYSFLSGVPIRPGRADFRLLDRQVVNDLLSFGEAGLFLRGLVHWVGYESAEIAFDSPRRSHGSSKYTLRKMLQLAWTAITAFSVVPLRLGLFLGLVTAGLSFAWAFFAVWAKLAGRVVPGWTSLVAAIGLLFGVLFMLIGIVGDYVGRILIEVKGRPRFLVSETVGEAPPPPGGR